MLKNKKLCTASAVDDRMAIKHEPSVNSGRPIILRKSGVIIREGCAQDELRLMCFRLSNSQVTSWQDKTQASSRLGEKDQGKFVWHTLVYRGYSWPVVRARHRLTPVWTRRVRESSVWHISVYWGHKWPSDRSRLIRTTPVVTWRIRASSVWRTSVKIHISINNYIIMSYSIQYSTVQVFTILYYCNYYYIIMHFCLLILIILLFPIWPVTSYVMYIHVSYELRVCELRVYTHRFWWFFIYGQSGFRGKVIHSFVNWLIRKYNWLNLNTSRNLVLIISVKVFTTFQDQKWDPP